MWRKLVGISFIFILMAGYLTAQNLSALGPSGGTGGNKFHDGVTGGYWPVELRVHSGWYIDAVQFVYKSDQLQKTRVEPKHGGNKGNLKTFKLNKDEYIVQVGGTYDRWVTSLYIVTNKNRKMEWGQKSSGKVPFSYFAPDGFMIYQFWGRSGQYVDAIGVEICPIP